MSFIPYLGLLLSSGGNAMKQFAMKNCGRRAPGAFNSICINMARSVICAVVSFIFWALTDLGVTNGVGYLVAIMAGIANAFSLFSWILASGLIPMSLIEIFSTFGSLVAPMLLAPYLFGGDRVEFVQWIGCVLLVLSVFTFVDMKRSDKSGERKKGTLASTVAIVALQASSTGAVTILQKYYNYHVFSKGHGTMEYFNLISFSVMVVAFLIAFTLFCLLKRERIAGEGGRIELPYKRVWFFIIMAGLGLYIAQYGSGVASALPSAIYFPLAKSVVMIETFLLDTLVFKDKFTVRNLLGVLLVIVAVILVNL